MHWKNDILRYSPSDLTVFLDGEFPSWMDRWYADQRAQAKSASIKPEMACPKEFVAPHACVPKCCPDEDAEMRLIARKGTEHEKAFLAQLKKQGKDIFECTSDVDAAAKTLAAM